MQSEATPVAADKSRSDPPSAGRLVIRITIPHDAPPGPARRSFIRRAQLPLILIAVAILLGWLGFSMFGTEPASEPTAVAKAPSAQPRSPAPAPEPRITAPTQAAVPMVSDAPPPKLVINEVIPNVPHSARDTISGTIRVTVRVIVAKDGAVLGTITEVPGPSRYFERLALESARKWTFAPSDTQEQRIMLVKFNFRRSGTTASASPVQ